MIQRIQSVFLFLVVLCMVALLFLPLWSKTDSETGEQLVLTAFSLSPVQAADAASGLPSRTSVYIAVLAILAAGIALFEIFQYRNRLLQMKLGALNSLIMAGVIGTTFYFTYIGDEMVQAMDKGEYEAGFYLPLLGLLLNALANRFIKKDENLVRSMDRLR